MSTSEGLRVIAYGTKFNVNAYDDEPFIEAVLEKGKIDVIRNDERIRLEPNKQVVLNKESGVFRVSAVNLDEKMDWRKGRMVFRNTPLEKVLKRLENDIMWRSYCIRTRMRSINTVRLSQMRPWSKYWII